MNEINLIALVGGMIAGFGIVTLWKHRKSRDALWGIALIIAGFSIFLLLS